MLKDSRDLQTCLRDTAIREGINDQPVDLLPLDNGHRLYVINTGGFTHSAFSGEPSVTDQRRRVAAGVFYWILGGRRGGVGGSLSLPVLRRHNLQDWNA